MAGRTRFTTESGESGGSATWVFSGTPIIDIRDSHGPSSISGCTDVVDGTKNDHFLNINRQTVNFIDRLNGRLEFGPNDYREFDNFIPALYNSHPLNGHLHIPLPSEGSAATTAKARTNPSRPAVSLPLLFGEMKDLPGLVRYLGHDLIKNRKTVKNFHSDVGDAFMSGIYGIAPMISDVSKLLDFQSHVTKRTSELQRLYSNGGLRRRITIQTESEEGPKTRVAIQSEVATVYANFQDVTTVKRWATIRWLPTSLPPFNPSESVYAKQARAVLLGLKRDAHGVLTARNDAWSDLSDMYNLMPWSWLVDWFTNVGDYIDSNRNSIPAQSSRVNVMTQWETLRTYIRDNDLSASFTSGGNASFGFTSKNRTQASGGTVAADFQFLSGRQLSILGALAMQRLRIR